MLKSFFFIVILISFRGLAQDTTYWAKSYDNSAIYSVSSQKDTLLIHQSSEGKVLGKCKLQNGLCHGTYTRYYPTGKKMWERNMVQGRYEGKSAFYNEQSKKVAEFVFHNDTLSDTTYLAPKSYFVFIKMTYRSVVYGGMENPDGTSNISDVSGDLRIAHWYVAEVDSLKMPRAMGNFITDFRGEAWLLLKAGKFNFFPISEKISELVFGQTSCSEPSRNYGDLSYSCNQPFVLNKKQPFLMLTIHQSSVGYAP